MNNLDKILKSEFFEIFNLIYVLYVVKDDEYELFKLN